jgi:hypothetical protein
MTLEFPFWFFAFPLAFSSSRLGAVGRAFATVDLSKHVRIKVEELGGGDGKGCLRVHNLCSPTLVS